MKKIMMALCILVTATCCQAQSPAEQVALRIAQKMKDTLSLTDGQKQSLYNVNLQLHAQKTAARQQYAGTDSLAYKVQAVENNRDSLYQPVLSEAQYLLYRQKKRTLVSNN